MSQYKYTTLKAQECGKNGKVALYFTEKIEICVRRGKKVLLSLPITVWLATVIAPILRL